MLPELEYAAVCFIAGSDIRWYRAHYLTTSLMKDVMIESLC